MEVIMKLWETRKSLKGEDADSGCVRDEVQHKHKDVTSEHECKNMTECQACNVLSSVLFLFVFLCLLSFIISIC